MTRRHGTLQLGEPIPLEMDGRYFQFNRQYAVRDVFDGLVELITNSDDSYHRLFRAGLRNQDGGSILIEYLEQRKGQPSIIRVRDRAEGMTLTQMISKLGNVGVRRSEEGDRGFMARGAKDCTELGPMHVESIKDERYYACDLTPRAELIPLKNGEHANDEIRSELGIKRGNGTVVTLTIDGHKMPRIATLVRDLPWHFALRDIMSETSATAVHVRNLNDPGTPPEPAIYHHPDGELVADEEFEVPNYPGVSAKLQIWRAPAPFETTGDRRFKRTGLLIKGKRAIHDCSLLTAEFEKDPYAARYFGRLECPHIDNLLDEWDRCRAEGTPHPESNPHLLIDPNRQHGLVEEHPFTPALFQIPTERLRALVARDREADRVQRTEIANRETKRRLDRLAKLATQFMKEQIEDLTELTGGDNVDTTSFYERGVMIVPTYVRLGIGEEKAFWMYVRRDLARSNCVEAEIISEDNSILTVLDTPIQLMLHPTKDDRLRGTFRVRANALTSGLCIQANVTGLPPAEAIIEVIERGVEQRAFTDLLEFEFQHYRIREGGTRTIQLYALHPDLVSTTTPVRVWSDDDNSVVVRGRYELTPIADSNFARTSVVVEGRRLNARANIWASVNGRLAVTSTEVIEKDRGGVPLRFDIRDEDYGNFRAVWADHEGEPNLLLISAKHRSVRRYLGPEPEFKGQDSPLFRLLLAEIVAESVCRRVLRLEAQQRSWEFGLAALKDDRAIVDDVLARLHRRIRDFVADAHEVMLSDTELNNIA